MARKRRRPRGRNLSGILVLDKPQGITSNDALQQAKWLFAAAKAGHTGSLDPLATGVLPLCFGEATKFSRYLLDADKGYRATVTFGQRSETGDTDGELIEDKGAENLTLEQIVAVLPRFRGEIEQVPSMYSAIKHQGQPLYKLARQGIEVEREARKVHIFRLEVLDFRAGRYPQLDIEVVCSKGTYIRTLAEDIGELLGCGALLSALHRNIVGPFTDADAVSLQTLQDQRGDERAEVLDGHLLPVVEALGHLSAVTLSESAGFYLRQGQPVLEASALKDTVTGELVRVVLESGEFLGVAEILDDGRVAPRRLIAEDS